MRSPPSKPLPKKGDLNKISFKCSTSKQARKTVSPKNVKKLVSKNLIKSSKKNSSKDDSTNCNKEDQNSSIKKHETTPDSTKPGPSKASTSRSNSPTKKPKPKKDEKEKKNTVKNSPENNVKKTTPKKTLKTSKKVKPGKSTLKASKDNNDVKYKMNNDVDKKTTHTFSKAKTIVKKGNIVNNEKKKSEVLPKENKELKEVKVQSSKDHSSNNERKKSIEEEESGGPTTKTITVSDEKTESNIVSEINFATSTTQSTSSAQVETPKAETERPPKFFTSSRSPRMVDIDVKCCKNSKGNLSVSERFVSMKYEPKTEELNKDKNASNTFVSQDPEIDVYTFTEKVDSPKSILSDFRSPINKNVGRVRPIARVKGTVIDKKTESEKKKYSPHRPIEEVVKQLKANKRSEEITVNENENVCATRGESNVAITEIDEDKPKPIVSKSYKMVARKSSITGKPFSPQFLDQEQPSPSKADKIDKPTKSSPVTKKSPNKPKKQGKKGSLSDHEIDNSKFALNTKSFHYTSSEESVSESNDDNDTNESSESDTPKSKKTKSKKYKRITDGGKKASSKELKELSKDSLIDLKDSSLLGNEKPSKRRLKLLSMWTGPKKHRMASLNAIAKVHCLYENESRTHMELGLMKTVDRQVMPGTSKVSPTKKKECKAKDSEKRESTSESEYESKKEKKDESSESSDDNPPQRTLRGVPGIRSAGKYWDPKSSTSSSEDSEMETKKKTNEKKKVAPKAPINKSPINSEKPPAKMKKTAGVPVKKKRNRTEVVMDLKDMVVQKRMASLNATAILAASYEKRSPKSNKDETTTDSGSDDSFSQKPKNGQGSGFKSELKNECEPKQEIDDTITDRKKLGVIVNKDTDVTITGLYSTHHHEGFCTVSGLQYRISSTSHTQTTATANCEQEGCSRDDGARYTPLSALSSMQPPADHPHSHPQPVPELGGLSRRPGCSSAFSAPTASHHEPG
ncbi:unnamed protein product [Arctia plantaginis]|uniref:Uncharacterized protein n=1 Tax=Arctia plantaginis TaxID=874455 RepID=A0A8S1B283_ARCPL|nr:unnamed protein product [Arctia plantaginis]CAB3255701.1 unnamed protein product [Arctia plantaginis]